MSANIVKGKYKFNSADNGKNKLAVQGNKDRADARLKKF